MLPEPFSVKGNDRNYKEQRKGFNSGIATNNKATLDVYIDVILLGIKCRCRVICIQCGNHVPSLDNSQGLMLHLKVLGKLQT